LKKAGNRQEFESYQTKELGARNAWQLTKPLAVRILRLRLMESGSMALNASGCSGAKAW
jgi:hypothetical protein